jgi:hypothetical protein
MDRRTAIIVAVAFALAVLLVLVLGVLRGAADGAVPRGHAELLGGDARTFLFWVEPGKLP